MVGRDWVPMLLLVVPVLVPLEPEVPVPMLPEVPVPLVPEVPVPLVPEVPVPMLPEVPVPVPLVPEVPVPMLPEAPVPLAPELPLPASVPVDLHATSARAMMVPNNAPWNLFFMRFSCLWMGIPIMRGRRCARNRKTA